jgi:hypothetical protein
MLVQTPRVSLQYWYVDGNGMQEYLCSNRRCIELRKQGGRGQVIVPLGGLPREHATTELELVLPKRT